MKYQHFSTNTFCNSPTLRMSSSIFNPRSEICLRLINFSMGPKFKSFLLLTTMLNFTTSITGLTPHTSVIICAILSWRWDLVGLPSRDPPSRYFLATLIHFCRIWNKLTLWQEEILPFNHSSLSMSSTWLKNKPKSTSKWCSLGLVTRKEQDSLWAYSKKISSLSIPPTTMERMLNGRWSHLGRKM